MPRFFVEAAGIRTGYYMLGAPQNPPVLLLHGMSTAADSFRETMYGLAADFWLIAPDIPGFGYSGKLRPYTMQNLEVWLVAFCDALKLSDIALVGHSFGGLLSASFTINRPQAISKLLLVAPSILISTTYPEILKRIAISLRLIDLGSAMSQSSFWVKRQIKAPFYDPDKQDETVWQRRLQDYKQARQSADVMKAAAFYDLRPFLPQIKQPVCLVWGQNDTVVAPTDAPKLAALLPDVQIQTVPESGHVVILEQPEAFQAITKEFLSRNLTISA